MSARTLDDRSMVVAPDETVAVAWVDIDLCVLGSRAAMTPEAVEKKWRRLLANGDGAIWPPLIGEWRDGRCVILDGRHEFVAALMMGRTRVLVAWKARAGT